jgi:hypothetical protein
VSGTDQRVLAERVGFEPTIRLPVCRISSAVLSTAQPPLRGRRSVRPARRPLCSQRRTVRQGRAGGRGGRGRGWLRLPGRRCPCRAAVCIRRRRRCAFLGSPSSAMAPIAESASMSHPIHLLVRRLPVARALTAIGLAACIAVPLHVETPALSRCSTRCRRSRPGPGPAARPARPARSPSRPMASSS